MTERSGNHHRRARLGSCPFQRIVMSENSGADFLKGAALQFADRWAKLFLEVLFHYRESGYLLHEFVLMPDHFHLLITPKISLERAIQYVKGGYSRRAKLEFKYPWEIWQRGFSDHRIRDSEDYQNHRNYIYLNPVRKKIVSRPEEYSYSSVAGFSLDPIPQWLKPLSVPTSGTAEAVPFQIKIRNVPISATCEAVPFQSPDGPISKPPTHAQVGSKQDSTDRVHILSGGQEGSSKGKTT